MGSHKTVQIPAVDGYKDSLWDQVKGIIVKDTAYNKNITIKSVHTDEMIYFYVTFKDEKENRHHRLQHWNNISKSYDNGPEREDSFIFKWNMSPYKTSLTLKETKPYQADIWYWKADRTDHAGYADDKIQDYSNIKKKNATMLTASNGEIFYLSRNGDSGEPAYASALYPERIDDIMPKFTYQTPNGSRADVRAKGRWIGGNWIIEFGRKLNTGHSDDVQLKAGGTYDFAVSITEIAGREPEPDCENPMFGAGEVGELISIFIE